MSISTKELEYFLSGIVTAVAVVVLYKFVVKDDLNGQEMGSYGVYDHHTE